MKLEIFVEGKIREVRYIGSTVTVFRSWLLSFCGLCIKLFALLWVSRAICCPCWREMQFRRKWGTGYVYSEDVLSLSMMLRSIGTYRNYGNVMRANWRILREPIKTRLLGTEVEYYISDIQEIGYIAYILARSLLPSYQKKKIRIFRNII